MDPWAIVLGLATAVLAAAVAFLLADRRSLRTSLAERDASLRALSAQLGDAGARASSLAAEAAAARARADGLQQRLDDEPRRLDAQRQELIAQFENTFAALAGKALDDSQQSLLRMASESLQKHHLKAEGDLAARVRAVDELVKPVRETLDRTGKRLEEMQTSHAAAEASFRAQIESLAGETRRVQTEAAKLAQALKAPQVRGRWGELTLRRVVEVAGMSDHCDFAEQESLGEGGAHRPDMLIHLPGGRVVVVDAKCPLHAYIEAVEADTDERRAEREAAHARQVRDRVDELAAKAYQSKIEGAPEFTVMFVPGDHFLSAALRLQPDLIEHAAAKSVVITTPATLIALLKAVSFGWAQASIEQDAKAVLDAGKELHDRVATMLEHLGKVGAGLKKAVASFNDAVGSMESRVAPAARRIGEMQIVRAGKQVEPLEPVTEAPRLAAPENGLPLLPER